MSVKCGGTCFYSKVSICACVFVCGDFSEWNLCHVILCWCLIHLEHREKEKEKKKDEKKRGATQKRRVTVFMSDRSLLDIMTVPHTRTVFLSASWPDTVQYPATVSLAFSPAFFLFQLFCHLPSLTFLSCFLSVCQYHHLLSLSLPPFIFLRLSVSPLTLVSSHLLFFLCLASGPQPNGWNQSSANPQLAGKSDWHHILVKM